MAYQLEIHTVLALSYYIYWGQRPQATFLDFECRKHEQSQGKYGKIWKFVSLKHHFLHFEGRLYAQCNDISVREKFLRATSAGESWAPEAQVVASPRAARRPEKNWNLDPYPLKCHSLHLLRGTFCLLTKFGKEISTSWGATLPQHIFTMSNAEGVSHRKEGPAKFWNLDPLKRNFLHFRE